METVDIEIILRIYIRSFLPGGISISGTSSRLYQFSRRRRETHRVSSLAIPVCPTAGVCSGRLPQPPLPRQRQGP